MMRTVWLPAFTLAFGLLGLAACYETPTPECSFACAPAGSGECPDNYTCRADGICKRAGVADDFACPDRGVDAPGADAPVVTDGPVDAPALIDAPDIDASEIDAPQIDAATPIDAAVDAPAAVDAFAGLRITTTGPIAFGTVTMGMTESLPVTVTNDGAATTSAITVTVDQTGGGNEIRLAATGDTCTGQTLANAATCTFNVEFAPSNAGAETGVATVSAATGGNSAINVTGTGQ